jgi:predicted DNA-binding transcriptional regulator AlpA
MAKIVKDFMAKEADPLITPKELAESLGVSENTLGIWRHKGTGPKFLKLSRRAVRYRTSAKQTWLDSREVV